MVALITAFVSWIIGDAFGLASGFSKGYALVSLFTPNSYTVELLFPLYFGNSVKSPILPILVLSLMSLGMMYATMHIYQQQVTQQG